MRGDREQGPGGKIDGEVLFGREGGVEDERRPDAGDGNVRQTHAAWGGAEQLESEEERVGREPDVEGGE